MIAAHFSFFPDLPFFLPADRRSGSFEYRFVPGQSIKHLVEAAGLPHTEVGRLVVNGLPVRFDYSVQQGDRVEVFPANAGNSPLTGPARFILDNHLGRLAAYLRMLGFDSLYRNDYADEELAEVAAGEERILLTRDRRLLMRRIVLYGYCLRSLDSRRQLIEVVRRFNLFQHIAPFRRCLRCNHPLQAVEKHKVMEQLEPLTRLYYEEFHHCAACGQVYWKGSHFERMQAMIDQFCAAGCTGPEDGEM